MSRARPASPPCLPASALTAFAVFALGALCASSAQADPLPPEAPKLSLEFEAQFAQPDDSNTRGIGAAFWAAYRFTDQLAATGSVSTLVTAGGPFSTAGFGVRALLDLLPLAPFVDVQVVLLGPEDTTHYSLATRIGGGVDYQVSRGLAVGLGVRTLTPVNGSASVSQGFEVAFRFIVTPALLN